MEGAAKQSSVTDLRSSSSHRGAMEFFRCRACGDVIGVYEPLVVCDEMGTPTASGNAFPASGNTSPANASPASGNASPAATSRNTSRAAEPKLSATGAAYYHRDCHAVGDGATRAPARLEASGR